ncbi:hypothetical protein CC80DRAFT_412137 [Byssothecium circinans]|uniref:DNA replication checkpoint mediator MRC1 domain-containing protein n=1 Tax=Byssothecium circinans TaxID=147558 RepID=A0A6A5TXY6_9PLEO|nr:hypothetical protein CC80DRAFT_412137 [Byssothecium circinans]
MKATNALSKLAESDSESDSQIAPKRKAGGGLLSRLQPHSDESSESEEDGNEATFQRTMKRFTTAKADIFSSDEDEEDEEDDNGEDAYERMKKQLAGGANAKKQELETVVSVRPTTPTTTSSSDEDEMPVLTVATRRLKPRKERAASPPTSHRVNRIRAERLAKKQKEKQNKVQPTWHETDEDAQSHSDGEGGRRLTQQAKPTRKAGKKAREAMVRDQQRIVRSMQLQHESKTKKRYGTKDLFAKLGFSTGVEEPGLPTPDASSPPKSSDPELEQTLDTSVSHESASMKDVVDCQMETPVATAPVVEEAPPPVISNKGKGRASEFQHLPPNPLMEQAHRIAVQRTQIDTTKPVNSSMVELSDSEDDLEIVQPKSRFPVFDKIPEKKAQESSSLLHLRHLAQLNSNDNGSKGKKPMNSMELQMSLHRKAREQAQKAREERLAELRAKGIHIETEEEREKRQAEVEDMVAQYEKALDHDRELAKRERQEAKKNGETGDGLVSSDEDEDYIASGEEDGADDVDIDGDDEEAELEFSGSEEEAEDETHDRPHGLFDEMADEEDEEETGKASDIPHVEDEDMEDNEPPAPIRAHTIKRARNVVVDDEDDDDAVPIGTPTQEATQDDAMAAFGFENAPPAMGLTQAFAGTMASLESDSQDNLPEVEQDSLDFLRSLPDTQPSVNFSQADWRIPSSQAQESQDGPVSQIDLGISQLFQAPPEFTATQLSEVPEPTQDAGFLLSRSPAGFAAMPSTVDTVLFPVIESPIKERKGKLHQRHRETPVELSDVDEDNAAPGSETEADETPQTKGKDVFSIMKKAAKKQKKIDKFNKQTSWAKDIVEEQADESEDEYAGLGGVSDDESGNEMDEELAQMIDTNDVKVNESELAAYFNEQETKSDAARAAKLHQDIVSGALRKRTAHGNAFDMSDSEDEHEMRRRKAQRERQRMTKAILQDERIGKLAQNAKQAAFLNTMIDTYDDSEYSFLNEPEQSIEESQSQSEEAKEGEADQDITIPDSQTTDTTNPLKRKSSGLDSQEKENRAPVNQHRTAAPNLSNPHKKARTLPEIQHQLSELLEDPGVVVPDSQYISDSDNEEPAPVPAPKVAIVDRLTLFRTSTSSSDASGRNMAFNTTAQIGGFRVPSLVRRATSNFSTVSERSTSNSGASTPAESVRRGGTRKSNIHAQAREAERRAVLEKAEKKRKESLKKKVGKARGVRSVLGSLGGGFE